MRNLGVTLTEIADLEKLAADCADDGQYAFLYAAAPLKVAKAAGTPGQPRRHQVGASMSAYDERPWLALYGDQPADYTLEFDNALDMFRAGRGRGTPPRVALQYFDGSSPAQELDELSDALAGGLLANGFAARRPARGLPAERAAVRHRDGRHLEGRRDHGVDQPDEPGRGSSSYLLKDSGATVLVCPGGAVRRGRPRRRARTPTCGWCSPPASWSTRPATTSGCSQGIEPSSGTRARPTSPSSSPQHRGEVPPPVELGPDDVAFLTYTSGTTGVPKGAMNTHRQRGLHRPGLPRLGPRRAGTARSSASPRCSTSPG